MAVYGAFIDDSGSHAESAIMVLGGLVASHEDWKRFSDDWYQGLNSDKPIKYFKSYEAESLTKCFAAFTRNEADAKIDLLTEITLNRTLYGMISAIRWNDFKEIIQGQVIKPKGRLHNYFKHPYYWSFHDVTSCILHEQVRRNLHDEIDFTVDRQGKFLTRCIRMYDEAKSKAPEAIQAIMGQVVPGDDKARLPLQAADLIAWQTRNRSWPNEGRCTNSAARIIEAKKVHYHAFSRHELRAFVAWINTSANMRASLRYLSDMLSEPDP